VLGQVVAFHIDESVLNEKGLVDVTRYQPLARLGYMDYAVVREVFSMDRPS
jgi:flavin reductase (DIM6/NTAB) family NADH-FMN oxidoreductase RutF